MTYGYLISAFTLCFCYNYVTCTVSNYVLIYAIITVARSKQQGYFTYYE